MGKEYITDTVTLEGDTTFDLKTQTQSKITQINYQDLEGDRENFFTKSAFSCQTTLAEASIDPSSITTISIGGFEDSVGANPFIIETANKIKIYTGEKPSKNKILIYQGKERFTIDKRGYVGINNRTPQSMLDVNGDINCDGDLSVGIPSFSNSIFLINKFRAVFINNSFFMDSKM